MALKLQVESLEGIDTALHGFYDKTESGYKLKVDGLEDTSGLRTALQKERESNKDAKTRLSELEKLRDEAEKKTLEEQGKFKELSAKDREEKLKYEQKFNELVQKISTSKRDLMLRELAASLTSDGLEQEIIARFAQDFVKIEGEEVSYTKDLEDLKKDLAKFVRSKATGTNDKGNNSGGGSKTFKDMTESERVELYRKNPDEYRRLAGTK